MSSLCEGEATDWRPELGFVVEGQCEVAAYPTMLAAQLGYPVGQFPIANAGGCHRVVGDLYSLLDDMCRIHRPRNVIVTVDSMDFADHATLSDCGLLRAHLVAQIDSWRSLRTSYSRGVTLPDAVIPVIQHRALETWLIADLEGLRQLPDMVRIDPHLSWTNVDGEVSNPVAWLRQRTSGAVNAKNPVVVKRIAKALNPERMRVVSRSFDKFYREVVRATAAAA